MEASVEGMAKAGIAGSLFASSRVDPGKNKKGNTGLNRMKEHATIETHGQHKIGYITMLSAVQVQRGAAEQLSPRAPTRAAGSTHRRRAPDGTSHSRPGGGRKDRGRAFPHHGRSAVTVEVATHSVKRSRPAGLGPARVPTRRLAGPPGRPENVLQKETFCRLQEPEQQETTGGAGVLQNMQQQG
jgi:hypothetical protein